jgi:DNA repair protein RadC
MLEKVQDIQIVSLKMVREKTLQYQYGERITSPNASAEILTKFIGDSDREVVALMSLSTKNQINSLSIVSMGSLYSSIVHPREIFKVAILSNAASIIIAHNHPSGDSTPSREDIDMTNRLKECGKLLGIELLDHIIIGDNNYTSLKESGGFI